MQYSVDKIVRKWLSNAGYRVSTKLFSRQLKSHPEYPSLLSITDTFDYMLIKHSAFTISKDQLHEVSTPFLAHLSRGSGEIVIVENRDTVHRDYPGFSEYWKGVVIALEKNYKWENAENEQMVKQEQSDLSKKLFLGCSVLLLALLASVFSGSWVVSGLMFVALSGIFISSLIISEDLGIENSIADKICGTYSDCTKVIHSSGAKLPLGIRWSDVGVSWFISLFVILVSYSFAGNISDLLPVMAIFSVPVFIFSFFSIYYQWQVIKKWCRLCLMIVGLLSIQFGILFTSLSFDGIQKEVPIMFASLLSITGLAWLNVKKILKENKELRKESIKEIRFKRNEHTFFALLEQQKDIEADRWEHDLQLGNVNASVQLIVACNPYCPPCARLHEKLHHMLETYHDKLGLTIRFILNERNQQDKMTLAVRTIFQHIGWATIEMGDEERSQYCQKVLKTWYEFMDQEKFSKVYKIEEEIGVDNILKQHAVWSEKSKIAFTPTVFINGRELPNEYSIDDLSNMINPLTEIFLKQRPEVISETLFV